MHTQWGGAVLGFFVLQAKKNDKPQVFPDIGPGREVIILLIRRLKMTAPNNSKCGMVCFFVGVTCF